MKSIRTKAASISASEIAAVAEQGVARALEARKAAGEELNAQQVEQVSGAAYASLALDRWMIYGGPWLRDMYGLGGYGAPVDQSIGAKTLIG